MTHATTAHKGRIMTHAGRALEALLTGNMRFDMQFCLNYQTSSRQGLLSRTNVSIKASLIFQAWILWLAA